MKRYWNGSRLTSIEPENGIEITVEEYDRLICGEHRGLEIRSNEDGYPTLFNPHTGEEYIGDWRDYEPPPYIPSYDELAEQYIAERYTTNQEIALSRQRDTKPEEWQEYFDYCEECKQRAKITTNSI